MVLLIQGRFEHFKGFEPVFWSFPWVSSGHQSTCEGKQLVFSFPFDDAGCGEGKLVLKKLLDEIGFAYTSSSVNRNKLRLSGFLQFLQKPYLLLPSDKTLVHVFCLKFSRKGMKKLFDRPPKLIFFDRNGELSVL